MNKINIIILLFKFFIFEKIEKIFEKLYCIYILNTYTSTCIIKNGITNEFSNSI